MNRRQYAHLAALYALAIAVRIALFDQVAIWGDMGFYQYDARLILEGGRPFIDFLGRSPVFIYLYAAAVAIFGHPTELVRAFMHFWWLLTAAPVYLIARHIRDHRSGLAALAIMLLMPFSLTYGSWANTQSVAAFFGILGVLAIVKSRRVPVYALAGVALGLAYLARRSMIVLLFAIGLYTVYSYVRYDWRGITTTGSAVVARGVAITGGFLATLVAVYAALAAFDPTTTYALFEVHTLNLFMSYGRGGYPLLGANAPIVTNELGSGRIPIFNDVCQMCGEWTARTFAKTTIVSVPVVGMLWYYLRDWTDHYFTAAQMQYMYGILAILGAYGVVTAVFAGYPLRAVVVVSVALFAWLAYLTDAIDRSHLYQRETQLILLVALGLAMGYLYRRRVLHTYYFMDFWPYLSILTGIIVVRAWELANRHSRVLLAIAIVSGTVAATFGAHPLMVIVMHDNDAGWFTMDNIHDYQADINERTDPGDRVLASNPSYVALSDAEMPLNRPRLHMVAVRYKHSGPGAEQYAVLNKGIREGRYEYAIASRTLVQMLRWNDTFQSLFLSKYCVVETEDNLYRRTNAWLLKWQPNGECHTNLTMNKLENTTEIGQ